MGDFDIGQGLRTGLKRLVEGLLALSGGPASKAQHDWMTPTIGFSIAGLDVPVKSTDRQVGADRDRLRLGRRLTTTSPYTGG